MTGCSAHNCNNSRGKGHLMKRFPTNPQRQAAWAAKIKRRNWTPSKNCVLCSKHFNQDQWVSSTKLKPSAVPTVFCTCDKGISEALSTTVLDHGYSAPVDQSAARPPKRNILGDVTNTSDHNYVRRVQQLCHELGCPMIEAPPVIPTLIQGSVQSDSLAKTQGMVGRSLPLSSSEETHTSKILDGAHFPNPEDPTVSFMSVVPIPTPVIDKQEQFQGTHSFAEEVNGITMSSVEEVDPQPSIPVKNPTESLSSSSRSTLGDNTGLCELLLGSFSEIRNINQDSFSVPSTPLGGQQIVHLAASTPLRTQQSRATPDFSSRAFPLSSSFENRTTQNSQSTILHQLSPKSKIKLAEKLLLRNITLQEEVKSLKTKLQREKSKSIKSVDFLHGRFGEDQLRALKFKSSQGARWKPETIKKALQIRFACGSNGYETVSHLQMPLPSIRCLQMHVKKISFDPGVLHKFNELMSTKVNVTDKDRYCVFGIDEMSIKMGASYDNGNSSLLGHCTLPGSQGMASKAVVGALGGCFARYKQTVFWHLTSSYGNPAAMGDAILQVITEAHKVGLYVLSLVSDFGMRDVMAYLGFRSRKDDIVWKIPHPCIPGEYLYWMPDSVHVFKNVSGMLVTNEELEISKEIVKEQDLPSNKVCKSHFEKLIEYQEDMDYSYAHKLKRRDLAGKHFSKMKVEGARHLLSMPTACGLVALSETQEGSPEMMTSAWFVTLMDRWFTLMTNRSFKMGLSKKNAAKYDEALTTLKLTIKVFKTMNVKGKWHPSQTALIMATEAFIEMSEMLLDLGLDFVLSGRFTQDFIENIFSMIRMQCPKPTALLFKYRLKQRTTSQFFKTIKTASYDPDGRADVVDLTSLYDDGVPEPKEPKQKTNVNVLPAGWKSHQDPEKLAEPQYRTYGYLLHCVRKYDKTCDTCYAAALHTGDVKHPASFFVTASNYKENAQVEVSDAVYQMLRRADLIFKREEGTLLNMTNANIYLKQRTAHLLTTPGLPSCHDIGEKLLHRFVEFRLKRFGALLSEKIKTKDQMVQLSSKTMGSGFLADQYCNKKAQR